MTDWTWRGAAGERALALPEADLYVVDLIPFGLARHSPDNEAHLLALLRGKPAVLLLASNDPSWVKMTSTSARQHGLTWLPRPYGIEDMRSALERAASLVRMPVPAPQTTAPTPTVASRTKAVDVPTTENVVVAMAVPSPATVKPATTAATLAPKLPVAAEPEPPTLSIDELRESLQALPAAQRPLFPQKLLEHLLQATPFEARFTFQNSIIVHPTDSWVASNTPPQVIRQVCKSGALASAVAIREMTQEQAEERAHVLGMTVKDLEAFLWDILATTLIKTSPTPVAPSKPKFNVRR